MKAKIYYKNKLIATAKVYNNLLRFKGLMFSKKLRENEGILFINKKESVLDSTLHTFFVFFPITIIWLDKNFKVVDTKVAKPFTFFIKPRKKAKYILEFTSFESYMLLDELMRISF